MSDRAALWGAAGRAAAAGAPAALATVARRRGSLPMASDAKLLLGGDGSVLGTIGGGCLEAEVVGQARDVLASGRPAMVRHTLNADLAGDLGLSCGGTVELFLEPVIAGAEAASLYAGVAEAITRRRRATVCTALGWDGGARKLLVAEDVVHAIGDWPAALVARASAASAAPAVPSVDDEAGLFVEPLARVPRVILFGGGHVAAEIARAAAGTDFHVVVVDDRDEFANRARFPTAAEIVVDDLRRALDGLTLDEDDYVIACTRGHAMDALVMERTAASPARYVGMLGSRRKQAVIWKALEAAGIPRPALERVKVPIGEDIAADTPGEIGIAVMAELIRIRRAASVRNPA